MNRYETHRPIILEEFAKEVDKKISSKEEAFKSFMVEDLNKRLGAITKEIHKEISSTQENHKKLLVADLNKEMKEMKDLRKHVSTAHAEVNKRMEDLGKQTEEVSFQKSRKILDCKSK